MNHIYVLENHKLGWWYVGTIKGEDTPHQLLDSSSLVNQVELSMYLRELVTGGDGPQLIFGHGPTARYYMAKRFVASLIKDIRKSPKNKSKLRVLLFCGWNRYESLQEWETITKVFDGTELKAPNFSTLWKFKVPSEKIAETLEDLKKNWGTPDPQNKYRSKKPLTFCLNKKGTGLSAQFLKNRNQIIRDMKKKKKRPKPATIEKYRITEHEMNMCLT